MQQQHYIQEYNIFLIECIFLQRMTSPPRRQSCICDIGSWSIAKIVMMHDVGRNEDRTHDSAPRYIPRSCAWLGIAVWLLSRPHHRHLWQCCVKLNGPKMIHYWPKLTTFFAKSWWMIIRISPRATIAKSKTNKTHYVGLNKYSKRKYHSDVHKIMSWESFESG